MEGAELEFGAVIGVIAPSSLVRPSSVVTRFSRWRIRWRTSMGSCWPPADLTAGGCPGASVLGPGRLLTYSHDSGKPRRAQWKQGLARSHFSLDHRAINR